ncbi:phosphoenolpyruvate carboxylase [Accumulibacter sp.]|uniref:phosphoenolpyruvate carboxylase n=1 Tax=Accumulibacter sp. TaxID=2053492 RepID=UPI00338F0DD6
MLGDTVRDQEGQDVFAIVEHIRQASVHLSQSPTANSIRQRAPNSKPFSTICRAIRRFRSFAFSYFPHLANIAEDQHYPPPPRARPRRFGTACRQPEIRARPRTEAGWPVGKISRFHGAGLAGAHRASELEVSPQVHPGSVSTR